MRRSWWGRGVVVAALVSLMTAGVAAPAAVAAPRAAEVVSAAKANRPPNRPTKVRFTSPNQAACVTGAARPVLRSGDLTLAAVLSDPDRGNVSAEVEVRQLRRPSTLVWSTTTAPQASGGLQVVRVDGLAAGSYRLSIAGRDNAGKVGPPVRCDFTVAAPVDIPVPTVTPAEGYPATYVEDAVSGGVGQTGAFVLGGSGPDVVYQYSIIGAAMNGEVPASDPVVEFTPSSPGSYVLEVRAHDAVGRVSATRTYAFFVAWPAAAPMFLFDDQTSPTRSMDGTTGLTLSPSTGWTAGKFADIGFDPADRALLFDEPSDVAEADEPLVDTAASFSVAATVRVDAFAPGGAAVVSQAGVGPDAMALGYAPCTDGTGSCWSFSTGSVTSVSEVEVVSGRWSPLVGLHDADAGTTQIVACNDGQASPGPLVPAASAASTGPTQVGRGASGAWTGAISVLRFEDWALNGSDLFRACNPVF